MKNNLQQHLSLVEMHAYPLCFPLLLAECRWNSNCTDCTVFSPHSTNEISYCTQMSIPTIYTRVVINLYPEQEGNKLQQPNSNFCKPLRNNSECFPSNQVSAAAMTSALDEKRRPFICFFSRVGLKTYQHPWIFISAIYLVFHTL